MRRRSPGAAVISGTPAASACRRTNAAWSGGSARVVVWIAPTARPRNTPGRPVTWSAWKWVSTTSGTRSMPRARRQRSTARGCGPASTTTPAPSPAASTSASPWPTSQATIRHPGGGQPVTIRVSGAGRHSAISRSSAAAAQTQRRLRRRCTSATVAPVTVASASPPPQPPGQSTSAPGRPAPVRATEAIHSAGQPAGRTRVSATGMATGAVARTASPSTVAGATASSASRLHGTATRLTRAARTATTGAQTAWAAAAAATISARRAGNPRRRSAALQPGAMVSSAAVPSTDSRKP